MPLELITDNGAVLKSRVLELGCAAGGNIISSGDNSGSGGLNQGGQPGQG